MTSARSEPEPAADLDVLVESERWAAAGLDLEALAQEAFAAAAVEIGAGPSRPAAVVFADDALVQRLNARHRGKDKPTNVLSFPAAPSPVPGVPAPLGDVVLAFETVAAEAEAFGVPLRARTLHMVVHGCLHLYGYDHEVEAEAAEMEALEARALARLGVADPYVVAEPGDANG
jgi:probable rRNA maturation factor